MTGHGDRKGRDELAELRSERFELAEAEQKLRSELDRERARSASLERDMRALRSSESFRLGHRLVWALERLPRRPAAATRWMVERARARSARRDETGALPGAGVDDAGRSAVLFIAWGVSEPRLRDHVARVRRLETQLVDLTPVFLVDSEALEPLRGTGWAVEYVIPLADWRRHRPAHEWGDYVAKRVGSLRERHGLRTVVLLENADGALDQGVLDAVVLPGLGASDDNLLEQD
jgi:hypothetical protein